MSILKKANAFLIQVDSTRKNYVPSQGNSNNVHPIFAEDVLLHNRLVLDKESAKTHPDFQQIKNGDYVIVFCNSLIPHSPNQIKFIFKALNKFENQVVLKIYKKLNQGYNLEHIYSLVDEGKLSKELRNCGLKEFKICKISFEDVELFINFDPIVRTYYSSSWKR